MGKRHLINRFFLHKSRNCFVRPSTYRTRKKDLDAKVTQYWPEFGQKGKENITVRMMLNHSAGLLAFREPIKEGGYYDWDYMVERLSKEAPF